MVKKARLRVNYKNTKMMATIKVCLNVGDDSPAVDSRADDDCNADVGGGRKWHPMSLWKNRQMSPIRMRRRRR